MQLFQRNKLPYCSIKYFSSGVRSKWKNVLVFLIKCSYLLTLSQEDRNSINGKFSSTQRRLFFVPITHTNIDITLIVSNVQPCVSNFLCCCNTRYCSYLIKKHVYSKSHTVLKASIGKKSVTCFNSRSYV